MTFPSYYSSESTWEPEENTNCPVLIEKYEQNLKDHACKDEPNTKLNLNGFDLGYEPEKILGATESDQGQLLYLIKWRNKHRKEFISSNAARKHCPQILIEFFEENSYYAKKK